MELETIVRHPMLACQGCPGSRSARFLSLPPAAPRSHTNLPAATAFCCVDPSSLLTPNQAARPRDCAFQTTPPQRQQPLIHLRRPSDHSLCFSTPTSSASHSLTCGLATPAPTPSHPTSKHIPNGRRRKGLPAGAAGYDSHFTCDQLQ